MKKITCYALALVLIISAFTGCMNRDNDKNTENTDTIIVEQQDKQIAEDKISTEQAIKSIQTYCYTNNPALEDIVNEGQYSVYWEIDSVNENEIVILFRSYTGAQNRYYIDRNTGETYVTEFVPGITDVEEKTDERFNIKDY